MARPIIIDKKTVENEETPRRGVLLFPLERKALKFKASTSGQTISEVLIGLMEEFIQSVETNGAKNVMYRYVGADITESTQRKKLTTQVFRCENDLYYKFTRYALSIGDNQSVFLRKLVREYLGEPITEFTPEQLDKELENVAK